MCGRYTIVKEASEVKERFRVDFAEDAYQKWYNAPPSARMPVITNKDPQIMQFFKWGLVPFWAKEKKVGNRMINLRDETVKNKRGFKPIFSRKRCLIPADGFYEWVKQKEGKQPFRFVKKDDSLFAFAGLWDEWEDGEGKKLNSYTIITTDPNPLLKKYHNRMPVILPRQDEEKWLGSETDLKELESLLRPYPDDDFRAYPVSSVVNSPANNNEKVLEEV